MLLESTLVYDSLHAFSPSCCQNLPWFTTHSMLFPPHAVRISPGFRLTPCFFPLMLSESTPFSDLPSAFPLSYCQNQPWFPTHSMLFSARAVRITPRLRLTPCFFPLMLSESPMLLDSLQAILNRFIRILKKDLFASEQVFLHHKFFINNLTTSAPPINRPRDVPRLHKTIINKIRVTLLCQKPFTL